MPTQPQDIYNNILAFLPSFFSGILSASIFLVIWVIIRYITKSLLQNKNSQYAKNNVILFTSKFINSLILAMAFITMLGTWGIDVRALVAGLGLTGFVLGFALKDLLSNVVAGVMIIFYQPLKIGSYVETLGVKGKVVKIDLRYTFIKDENNKHLIPNSKLLSEKITIIK
jgi:small-conductance mechanosensitive channel